MAIDRTAYNALVDDDGSNTSGSFWNKNAIKTVILDPVDDALAAAGASTITTIGTQAGLAIPAGSGALTIFANNASLLTIQGIAPGVNGQQLTIYAIGAGEVDLVHQSGSATAATYRLVNIATSGLTPLAGGSGSATFIYDGTAQRWRLTAHEQGAWLTRAYAAGNYTGLTSQTWTVDSGDITSERFWLKGRTLCMEFIYLTTSVGGTPSAGLKFTLPWGLTTQGASLVWTSIRAIDNGVNGTGLVLAFAVGGTEMICYKDNSASGNWTASTNNTALYGSAACEVN
jgi:hypothetical protein